MTYLEKKHSIKPLVISGNRIGTIINKSVDLEHIAATSSHFAEHNEPTW